MSAYTDPDHYKEEVKGNPELKPDEPQKSHLGTGLMFISWGLLLYTFPFIVHALGLSFYGWTNWIIIFIGFVCLFLGISGACMELNK